MSKFAATKDSSPTPCGWCVDFKRLTNWAMLTRCSCLQLTTSACNWPVITNNMVVSHDNWSLPPPLTSCAAFCQFTELLGFLP